MESAQNHTQQGHAELGTLLHIIVGKRNHMIAHSVQKRFTVQFAAVFLPVHITHMGGIALDFNEQLHIPGQPGEISKIGSSPPVGHLIFGMKSGKMSPQGPPDIAKE
ncbi:hypothetical protein D3C81_1912020 [compost metagenome]